eukprot:289482-Chlamydomonas_euryale.AAC.2
MHGARSLNPQARGGKGSTRNPQPATRNPQARGGKGSTCNPQPATSTPLTSAAPRALTPDRTGHAARLRDALGRTA